MKTKLIVLISAILGIFCTKALPKIAIGVGTAIITSEALAQDHTHKANFTSGNPYYIFIDTFESMKTEMPVITWPMVQDKPAFRAVAISGSYLDLEYTPDLNNLPNYYPKYMADTIFKPMSYFPNLSLVSDSLSAGGNKVKIPTGITSETDPNVPAYSKTLNNFSVIKTSTDVLYKSSSYTPSASEIGTALGYTPYNGSTNPNGFINQQYSATQGMGIKVTGLFPNQTIAIDTSVASIGNNAVMTVGKANNAISNLQNNINGKQSTLVSGTNIKTIESQSVLGSGNIDFSKSDVGLSNVDNTSDISKPISSATQTALNAKQATLVSGTNIKTVGGQSLLGTGDISVGGTGTVTSLGITSTDLSVSGSPITTNGDITVNLNNSGVTAGTYNTVTVDAKGRVTAGTISSASAVTRPLNTSFQISTTQATRVSYSVTHSIALTLLLTSGSSMVYLEISPNNSTWTTISQAGYSDGVAVAVALTKSAVNNVQGEIPAGYYVRLRTAVSGGGSATYTCGQETQY